MRLSFESGSTIKILQYTKHISRLLDQIILVMSTLAFVLKLATFVALTSNDIIFL